MPANNKKCICCGAEYTYCFNCEGGRLKNAWRNNFHDENCRTIFNTAVDLKQGVITPDRAKEIFSRCDTTRLNNFAKPIRDAIRSVSDIANKKYSKKEER